VPVGSPRVTYAQRQDTTPEAELNALAAIYSLALQAHLNRKKGGPETAPDDATKGFDNDRATNILPHKK
jgi:hypothetical protein